MALRETTSIALVVDDHHDSRAWVEVLLETSGYQVRGCDSARAALALIAEEQIDVLVSDVHMPDQDGYWLIGRIRALPDSVKANVPALAFSGTSSPTAHADSLRAGFDHHVAKPCDPMELLAVVASLMARGPRC